VSGDVGTQVARRDTGLNGDAGARLASALIAHLDGDEALPAPRRGL
jgi:hypothetical protein